MKGAKGWFGAAICLWLAGGCQMALSPRLEFWGGGPDFPLVVLATLGLMAHRRGGATLGFVAGLLRGAISGANLTAYAVTRTIVGFLIGWFNELEFEGSPWLAAIVGFSSTLVGQVMLMFGVHRGPIVPFLAGTIVSAVVNGVLAMPVYAVMRRLFNPPTR